jgi:hypothetical protein
MKPILIFINGRNGDDILSRAPISSHRILDVLKESKKLKVGQKWTAIVTPKAQDIEGFPAKLEFLIGPTSPFGIYQINWNDYFWGIWQR